MKRPCTIYINMIMEHLHCSEDLARCVENVMRTHYHTLDGLGKRQFINAARASLEAFTRLDAATVKSIKEEEGVLN